jgi:hypothetical protein
MNNDLDWKQPAMVGGLIVGICSALPGISALNCCFCGWALIGAAIAVKMTINNSSRPLQAGDGARIGLFVGIIAAVVFIFISVPINLSGFTTDLSMRLVEKFANRVDNPELQEAMMTAIARAAEMSPIERVLTSIPILIAEAFLQVVFTVLGGLLAIPLFEKRKDLPPPPPNYGDTAPL